jgi:2-dehydro-3-deoxy-D-arabinonate dehydratase
MPEFLRSMSTPHAGGGEMAFPSGVFLMTGTGVVPPDDFSLEHGDVVRITIGGLTLENTVRP